MANDFATRKLHNSILESFADLRKDFGVSGISLKVVVAVSGGIDSICLLEALAECRAELGLQLVACHVDHGLRPCSAEDASFVEELSKSYQIPYHVYRLADWDKRQNVEAWAREERYRALEKCRLDTGAALVVTGQHKNDQVETFLFRLLTGRLATSVSSMRHFSRKKRVFRPFANITREDLLAYYHSRELRHVADETNDSLLRTRNKIRLELIPQLAKEYNPDLLNSLDQTLDRFAHDDSALREMAVYHAKRTRSAKCRKGLVELPEALRWRVIGLIAERKVGGRAKKLGYRTLSEISRLLLSDKPPVGALDIGFGVQCVFDRDGGIEFKLETALAEVPLTSAAALAVPGEVFRNYDDDTQASVRARVIDRSEVSDASLFGMGDPTRAAFAYFDAEQLARHALHVREWREGDSLRVWKRGSRKLKKLFQEQHLPLELRRRLPVVELDDGSILWVPGVARSETAAITDKTSTVVEVYFERQFVLGDAKVREPKVMH